MVEIELAIVGEAHGLDASIFLFGQELPWHEVGVMIHRRHDDEIAGLMLRRPHVCATRLIASVVLRTKTISRADSH